jgi:hypothetical protein
VLLRSSSLQTRDENATAKTTNDSDHHSDQRRKQKRQHKSERTTTGDACRPKSNGEEGAEGGEGNQTHHLRGTFLFFSFSFSWDSFPPSSFFFVALLFSLSPPFARKKVDESPLSKFRPGGQI